MELLGSVLDHLARDQGRGHSTPRLLEAWMPIRSLQLLGDVAYGSHSRQRLDLYRPHQAPAECRLIVFLYGGCWTAGSRRSYRFLARVLCRCGFAVAIPDYRLFPEASFPDFLVDTASAIGWLHRHAANHGIDGRRVALIGHSAGAYNAAMVALDSTYLARAGVAPEVVAGVVGLVGPYAFNPLDFQETRDIFAPSSRAPDRVQPLRLIRPRAPPMLLAHGGADRRVLPINSVRFAAAMRAAGNDANLQLYPRHSHVGLLLGLANPFHRLSCVLNDTVGFLNQVLDRERQAG
jgi:acetyl esterase/lipase